MSGKPTYEELAEAFWQYLADTTLDGYGVAPDSEQVGWASYMLRRSEVPSPYEGPRSG